MLARHSLVWLAPAGWQQAATGQDAALQADLQAWSQAGWPAVARRTDALALPGQWSLGLPLPPDQQGNRRRAGLLVKREHALRIAEPLALADAACAPSHWQAALAQLIEQGNAHGITWRVTGSLAMQQLTGQAYLRAGSDIDILASPTSVEQLATMIALLVKHVVVLPLDGEIIFPGGQGVAWKEWQRAQLSRVAQRVLAKHTDGVALLSSGALLDQLAAAPALST